MTSIALFGPSGSGKTTLVMSFLWKMGRYYRDNKKADPKQMEFRIEIMSRPGEQFSLFEVPVRPDGTRKLQVDRSRIGRVVSNPDDYGQTISAAIHEILFADQKGNLFHYLATDTIDNPDKLDFMKDQKAQSAWTRLKMTANTMILLDPCLLKDSMYADYSLIESAPPMDNDNLIDLSEVDGPTSDNEPEGTDDKRRLFSQAEYARMVGCLRWLPKEVMRKKKNSDEEVPQKRRVAICVTKSDILGDVQVGVEPKQVVEEVFGGGMIHAIHLLEDAFGRDNVQVFLVSAMGFDPATGERNYEPSTQWLKNTSIWRPEHVEDPIFWTLESVEKEMLQDTLPSIPLLKGLIKNSVKNSREKAYIHYPRISWQDFSNKK